MSFIYICEPTRTWGGQFLTRPCECNRHKVKVGSADIIKDIKKFYLFFGEFVLNRSLLKEGGCR